MRTYTLYTQTHSKTQKVTLTKKNTHIHTYAVVVICTENRIMRKTTFAYTTTRPTHQARRKVKET